MYINIILVILAIILVAIVLYSIKEEETGGKCRQRSGKNYGAG